MVDDYDYQLKSDIIPGSDWVSVSKEDWIKAERAAGFRPSLSSDHPSYMTTCATGGFSNSLGVSGQIVRKTAPSPYRLGVEYQTQGGEPVTFTEIANEGTMYETMACEDGVHRYTRRDFGRVTGSPHDYSDHRNVPPPQTRDGQ